MAAQKHHCKVEFIGSTFATHSAIAMVASCSLHRPVISNKPPLN